MSETAQLYYVFNDTDGVYAHPDPMSHDEAVAFMLAFVARYNGQGYYASAHGRIPLSQLRLTLLTEEEAANE